MKNNFAFLSLSNTITGVVMLSAEVKEKRNPFIIVNTDNNRGLYVRKLEQEIAKYKNLKSQTRDKLRDIETTNLIVFGDSPNFDYRIDMNYFTIASLSGKKDLKVYDLVDDFDRIVRRLSTYCSNNGIKKTSYAPATRYSCVCVEEPKPAPVRCPLFRGQYTAPAVERTLVSVYAKPNVSVEKITVHSNWVKIGYNSYDIYVDLLGNEVIFLEDGEKMYVKTDRFGRRYLTA